MKISEVMTRAVDLADRSETVQAAATRMAELDVGAVFVGNSDTIEGVLTDRDVIVRVVVEGKHPAEVEVGDVMTPNVIVCHVDDAVEAAFSNMREGQFRRMPVLDDQEKPVGVVTLSDLAKHVESPEKIAEGLRELSDPHRTRKVADEPQESDDVTGADPDGSDSPEGKQAVAAA